MLSSLQICRNISTPCLHPLLHFSYLLMIKQRIFPSLHWYCNFHSDFHASCNRLLHRQLELSEKQWLEFPAFTRFQIRDLAFLKHFQRNTGAHSMHIGECLNESIRRHFQLWNELEFGEVKIKKKVLKHSFYIKVPFPHTGAWTALSVSIIIYIHASHVWQMLWRWHYHLDKKHLVF